VNTDGTGFTNLHSFTGRFTGNQTTNSNAGYDVDAGLVLSGNVLFGTTQAAGGVYTGTVYALSLPIVPALGASTVGNQIVFSWPTNAMGYALQSADSLTGGWSNVTSGTTIIGTNYVFTPAMNSSSAFFRLAQ
jgi:hypothetical protein